MEPPATTHSRVHDVGELGAEAVAESKAHIKPEVGLPLPTSEQYFLRREVLRCQVELVLDAGDPTTEFQVEPSEQPVLDVEVRIDPMGREVVQVLDALDGSVDLAPRLLNGRCEISCSLRRRNPRCSWNASAFRAGTPWRR